MLFTALPYCTQWSAWEWLYLGIALPAQTCENRSIMSPSAQIPDINTVSGPILIAGLGNPGAQYELTRHNVGYMALDELCERTSPTVTLSPNKRTNALVGRGTLNGTPVILMKSRTYMNDSGRAIAATAQFFSVPATNIIVLHDDLDLEENTLRLKRGGGEGGHNGLKSMTQHLGTKDYLRVRIGIGRPRGRMNPADYVLKQFSARECEDLGVTIQEAADAVELLLQEGLASTQNRVHSRH